MRKGKSFDVRLSAIQKEHTPMGNTKVNNEGNEIEEKKEGNWFAPKHVLIDCFHKKHETLRKIEKLETTIDTKCYNTMTMII